MAQESLNQSDERKHGFIDIDFMQRGGEEEIFKKLEEDKIGIALLNGTRVFVKRCGLDGKNSVAVLKTGDVKTWGWETFEVMQTREKEIEERKDIFKCGRNIIAIIKGTNAEIEALNKRDSGSEEDGEDPIKKYEKIGEMIGKYLNDKICACSIVNVGPLDDYIEFSVEGANLTCGAEEFFNQITQFFNSLSREEVSLKSSINQNTAFSARPMTCIAGEWDNISHDALRKMIEIFDRKHICKEKGKKGILQLVGEYNSLYGFEFLVLKFFF